MAHFFAPNGNLDNFEDIGRFAPDSVSRANVAVKTSFEVALWGGKDLKVRAEPMMVQTYDPQGGGVVFVDGISLEELPPMGDSRKFRCLCSLRGTFRIQTYTDSFFFAAQSVGLEVVVGDGTMTKSHFARFVALRAAWIGYRAGVTPTPAKFDQLRQDLYKVRNADWNGNPPISVWPANLIDPDDGMMASIEHYFLCRAWVGGGKYPASEMRLQTQLYDLGKELGVTPQHNPNKPTTPLTDLQLYAQTHGIMDGEADLAASGQPEPGYKMPAKYY
jgi:hypothetical protein